jgi:hypothetical protein
VQHAAATEDDAGSDSGATGSEKITAGGHGTFPPFFVLLFQAGIPFSE